MNLADLNDEDLKAASKLNANDSPEPDAEDDIVEDEDTLPAGEWAVLSADNKLVPRDTIAGEAMEMLPTNMSSVEQYMYITNLREDYNKSARMGDSPADTTCSDVDKLIITKLDNQFILHLDLFWTAVSYKYHRRVMAFLMSLSSTDRVIIIPSVPIWTDPLALDRFSPLITAITMCKANIGYHGGHLIAGCEIGIAFACDYVETSTLGGLFLQQAPSDTVLPPYLRPIKMQWLSLLKKIAQKGWLTNDELDKLSGEEQVAVVIYGADWVNRINGKSDPE